VEPTLFALQDMTELNASDLSVLVHQATLETLLHTASEANVKQIMNALITELASTTNALTLALENAE